MLCEDARAQITAYLAEELAPELWIPLEAHLAGCASCRVEVEAFRETWRIVGELPAPRPAPDLEARVFARAAAEATPLPAWRLLRAIRVPIAALVAVLLSIGLSRLLPYEAAARLCRETLGNPSLGSGLSEEGSAFLVGALYALLPVLLIVLSTARLDGWRPLLGGGCTATLFVLALTPYVLAVCSGLPGAFVGSLLAGLTVGAFTGGLGGFWLGRRGAAVVAST